MLEIIRTYLDTSRISESRVQDLSKLHNGDVFLFEIFGHGSQSNERVTHLVYFGIFVPEGMK
jgi:hypothetical protein